MINSASRSNQIKSITTSHITCIYKIYLYRYIHLYSHVCMIVCMSYIYEIYAYCILSQRRTESHISTVNTMTEALDIQRPDILNSLMENKKMASQKYINTSNSAVTSTQLISKNYNHFSDITIIFYMEQSCLLSFNYTLKPVYDVEQVFCGSCWMFSLL